MQSSRISAILFDMDGVLIDSYEAWFELVAHGREVLGGPVVTRELFHELLQDELKKTPSIVGAEAFAAGKYAEGARLFEEISTSDDYVEFLTLPAYKALA